MSEFTGFFQIDEYSGIEVICDVTLMRLILRLSDNVGRSPLNVPFAGSNNQESIFQGGGKRTEATHPF